MIGICEIQDICGQNSWKKEFLHHSATRHPKRRNELCVSLLQRWFILKHSSPTRHPHIAYHTDIEQLAELIHSSP